MLVHAAHAFAPRRFSRDADTFAVRDFDWGARAFKKDEPFPWKAMGIPLQRAHELWVACLIDCREAPPAPAEPVREPPRASRKDRR